MTLCNLAMYSSKTSQVWQPSSTPTFSSKTSQVNTEYNIWSRPGKLSWNLLSLILHAELDNTMMNRDSLTKHQLRRRKRKRSYLKLASIRQQDPQWYGIPTTPEAMLEWFPQEMRCFHFQNLQSWLGKASLLTLEKCMRFLYQLGSLLPHQTQLQLSSLLQYPVFRSHYQKSQTKVR